MRIPGTRYKIIEIDTSEIGYKKMLLLEDLWTEWVSFFADSALFPQLNIELIDYWKLCFNLCSRKWLRQSRIHVKRRSYELTIFNIAFKLIVATTLLETVI